jgi:nucleotide-binding universal stress UspA family protein
MALRNILVHATEDDRCGVRVGLAADLAAREDGAITGLFVRPNSAIFPAMMPDGAVILIEDMEKSFDKIAQYSKEAFMKVIASKGIEAEWREDRGETGKCLAFHGRYTDMVVVGQWSPDDPAEPGTIDLGGTVALGVGRPVLLVPHAGTVSDDWKRIMVAWDSSRAATRAVHDAMDFLKAADRVDVVCVDPEGAADRDPGADIAAHLARHGVTTQAHRLTRGNATTAETLLSAISDMGSNLLVMGAFGHNRLAAIVFGGVTRNMLKHMTVPVLMSN